MFILQKQDGNARVGLLETVHGTVKTPVFMNVGTSATVKGGVAMDDLMQIKCKIELSNTYHLHIRPGDEIIRDLGGLHKFCGWSGPILTDSGGFQVFSLAKLRKIKEEGVYFSSHLDGARIFMGPEESMQIQSNLASTIAMAFDECIPADVDRGYVERSCAMTVRWLERCVKELDKLNAAEGTINPSQVLFGINQGGVHRDLRIENMHRISEFDLPGYAIGGLAVGESAEAMYDVLDTVVPEMPSDKPRYLMGVGTPNNILEAVRRGIDMFDCVMPSRNARHGSIFSWNGRMNLQNEKYKTDGRPIDENCACPVCRKYSRAYIRHLFRAHELLGGRLCVLHNLYFYNELMERIIDAIEAEEYEQFYRKYSLIFAQMI